MSDFKPMGYALLVLLFIGVVFPFILGYFIDVSTIETSGFSATLVDLVQNGFELSVIPFVDFDDFNINPFSWLGNTLHLKMIEAFQYLGLLPDFIVISILILCIVSIFYTLIKMLPAT